MSIPFDTPASFLLPHSLGQVQRYGAILKDVSTGRIVAHLQETGALHSITSVAPNFLNPVSGIVNSASGIASNVSSGGSTTRSPRFMG